MPDYSKTIMYRIVCNDLSITDCYVGHTTNLTKRKSKHKDNCNNPKSEKHNLKIYQFIRDNGGWNNFTLVQIEIFNCKNANEARARERELYEQLNSTMNSVKPNRTLEEKKFYYRQNSKVFREDNKDYDKDYNEAHKKERQQYRDLHREERRLYMVKYNNEKRLLKNA